MVAKKRTTKKATVSIYEDTPIIPVAVAESVLEEVIGYLSHQGHEADASLIYEARQKLADDLADRAEAIYKHNEQFRKKIRGSGNKGRDYLYAFMRHWLASDLKKKHWAIYNKLPRGFDMGMGMGLRENRGSGSKRSGRKSNKGQMTSRKRNPREVYAKDLTFARQMLPRGTRIYAVLVSHSASGTRKLVFFAPVGKEIQRVPPGLFHDAGYRVDRNLAVVFSGGGYSAVQAGVEALGQLLYNDGQAFSYESSYLNGR